MQISKVVVGSLTAAILTAMTAYASDPAEKQAQESAQKWLALVDAGSYGKSWNDAAAYFKGKVSKSSWEKSVKSARQPFGPLVSRTLKSATATTQLPGAPDGQYMVIQFDSKFQHKSEAVETITPMLDHGVWKVSGYFIK